MYQQMKIAYSWEQNRDATIVLLDHLSIQKTHVIGLSMNGFEGLLLPIRHRMCICFLVATGAGSVAHPLTRFTFIKEALNASERKINKESFTTNNMAHAGNHIKLKHKVSQGWT